MHPYANLREQNFWRKFVSNEPWRDLAFNNTPKFKINPEDKISTAGSCFAQHIARYMKKAGLETYIAEKPHPLMKEFGGNVESYELFSARFGNIYTVRQCLELYRQAFGHIPVIEDFVEDKGRFYDLLRPNILPDGFASLSEAKADRIYHLGCVKKMFENSDIFVFTLGLTESWYNARLGHTYPVCPGTARGVYIPEEHCFRNLTCSEVVSDLDDLICGLKVVNQNIKIILTVSPVPLVATYTNKNVLIASSYSKSVLRAACGEVEPRYDNVQYFPSYEIISHAASFGQYLDSDLRGVTERGVSHVMNCFFSSFYDSIPRVVQSDSVQETAQKTAAPVEANVFEVECDELFNEIKK